MGQSALLLQHPEAAASPFYMMAPRWALIPLVILATFAAVIASQALISGAFSLTRQAIQLGYCPRLNIEHTSAVTHGQIYISQVNWALMICTIGLVLGFQTSSNLASAYGIAVGATMAITTMLTYLVARSSWGLSRVLAGSVALFFLLIEFGLFGANLPKIPNGGWFPLVVAAVAYVGLSTWKKGRALLGMRLKEKMYPFEQFLKDIARKPPHRVAGTAVFMTSNIVGTPPTLLHNMQHNKVLHDRIILLTVVTTDAPFVSDKDRVTVDRLGEGFYRMTVKYGFMQEPDVPAAVASASSPHFPIDLQATTFFVGIETLLPTRRPGMALWRERLFALMSKNAVRATSFYRIPPERVVEIGMQVEL
jgi:KUP system potassium uptake protein